MHLKCRSKLILYFQSRNSNVDRNGIVNIEDSNGQNVFNSKKLSKEQHEQMMNQINQETRRIQQQQKQFELQMHKFQEDMQRTFGNGFPFGNRGFPFAPNFPFYQPTFSSYNAPFYHASPFFAPAQFTPHNAQPQHYENSYVDSNEI